MLEIKNAAGSVRWATFATLDSAWTERQRVSNQAAGIEYWGFLGVWVLVTNYQGVRRVLMEDGSYLPVIWTVG